jgi:N-acylglucosamine 2-epimerase
MSAKNSAGDRENKNNEPRCIASVEQLIAVYRDGLLEDVVPFWIEHAVDREDGGYFFCLDRNGAVFDTDKPMWLHSRFVWLLSSLYSTTAQREEWLELARHGLEFILAHGFDEDGRMFFLVDREGRPLRKRRYLFTECFAVLALAAFGHASDQQEYIARALDLFRMILRYHESDGRLEPKFVPET